MSAQDRARDARDRRDPPDRPVDLPERGPVPARKAMLLQLQRVDVDTWVDRPDLPPGSRTFVAAGDHVPPELAGYDRAAAE